MRAAQLPGSNLFVVAERTMALEFMQDRLALHPSADFQGAMFIRPEKVGKVAQMDDVAVAYGWHGFIGRICLINIVVQDKECLTRPVIREAFRYPFKVAGCNAVIAAVDSTNLESIDLCRRTGFKLNSTIIGGGLEGDLLMFEMRKEDCRWMRKEH